MSSVRTPEKDPCWIVWELHDGKMYLRSICSDAVLAGHHSRIILKEAEFFNNPRPRLHIEKSQTNHLYGRYER